MADFTLVATADWDHPLWTNKQHVAQSLSQIGHRVLYVESLGLRAPRREIKDWGRILRRLKRALKPPQQVSPGVWVWSPLLLPGVGRYRALQALNRWVFAVLLKAAEHRLRFISITLWSYNPCILEYLLNPSAYARIVYHCVDDIQAQPGMDVLWLDQCEKKLLAMADCVFVTSPALLASRGRWARRIYYNPNVVEFDHFASARSESLPIAGELTDLPKPRLGFIGALSAYKIDFELITALAQHRPDWTFVLIGPTGEGEVSADLTMLTACANVYWLGARAYGQLPSFLKGLDVALLPLRDNAYTRAMFPMKFFEYLAAGLPIVATPIRSLLEYSDLIYSPDSHSMAAWQAAILLALQDTAFARQRRIACAARNTYRERTRKMLADLAPELVPADP